MRRILIGVSMLALLGGPAAWGQDMELSNPETSEFDAEGQAADLGGDLADRAVIDGEGQAADLGGDLDDRAGISDESQEGDLEPY